MAVRILSLVWDGYPGGGTELLALLALANWSDDEGRCWPSIAAIGKKTRLSRSQAQRVVHRLIETGYVAVTGNETGGPPGSTRQYLINLDMLTGRMDATPTGRTDATGTGSAHATGRTDATGRTHAADGSHLATKTGSTHATQTVSEPSTTVNLIADKPLIDGKAADLCPHQQIIDLYHELLPAGRHVRAWNETRKAKLRTRWREDKKRQSLDWWRKLFAYIGRSDFLTGRTNSNGRAPFELDLEWIVTPANFVKIIEGKYDNREAA